MNNVYGITKPSLVNPERDVDIFYSYRATRNSNEINQTPFIKMTTGEVSSLFNSAIVEDNTIIDKRLPGMYNLQLPVDIFGQIGYYTIYITPKSFRVKILDVGVLTAYPDVKGIIVDLKANNGGIFNGNDHLAGYRVEYLDSNGNIADYFRFITSNTKCEPVSQNLTSSYSSSHGYRYTESGTLSFITVTPSMAPSYKANRTPYIGTTEQEIIITNTFFDPVMLEVQIVKHDDETISTMLEGNQIRNKDRGLITTYNENGEPYIQHETYTVKSEYTTSAGYEVKKNRGNNIDFSGDYENLIGS